MADDNNKKNMSSSRNIVEKAIDHKTIATEKKEDGKKKINSEWSPLMDSIYLVDKSATNDQKKIWEKEFNNLANEVLYGPKRTTRRLPVFKEICPDE